MAGVRSLLPVLLLTESPVAACSLPSLHFFQPLNTRQTVQTWSKTTSRFRVRWRSPQPFSKGRQS